MGNTPSRIIRFISCDRIARLLPVIALSLFISGCGVTLGPVKRAPLQIGNFETSLPAQSQIVLIRVESTLPGKPLFETVWDNASGPFADAEESRQIGFTQNYAMVVPAAVLGGAVGAAVVASQPDYTRIVIPFGRIFGSIFQSGARKVFPNSSICFADSCESTRLPSPTPNYIVTLKVTEFKVWENPLNHMNLKAAVACKVQRAGTTPPLYSYEVRHEVASQSIGSVMTTSSGFIEEMNKVSNSFAATLSQKILEELHRQLEN